MVIQIFFSYFLLLRAITLSIWSLGLISSWTPSWCSSLQNWLSLNVSFLMWPNKESNKNLQHHRFKVVTDGLASLNAHEKKMRWPMPTKTKSHKPWNWLNLMQEYVLNWQRCWWPILNAQEKKWDDQATKTKRNKSWSQLQTNARVSETFCQTYGAYIPKWDWNKCIIIWIHQKITPKTNQAHYNWTID